MKKLHELVDIRSGYTFRVAIDSFDQGDVEVIQAKDLGDDFNFATRPKIKFSGEDKHLLKPGEILLSARGYAKAIVYRSSHDKAVASSSLFVLRPKSASIDPSYIALFFNSLLGIKEFIKLSSGASVKTITKEDLGQIEIPEIPPEREHTLGNLVQTINDYQSLLLEKNIHLDNLRSTIISKTLKETIK